jgi:hypothetical protein
MPQDFQDDPGKRADPGGKERDDTKPTGGRGTGDQPASGKAKHSDFEGEKPGDAKAGGGRGAGDQTAPGKAKRARHRDPNDKGSWAQGLVFWGREAREDVTKETIDLEEVMALLRFVSNRGLDPDNRFVKPLYEALKDYATSPDPETRQNARGRVLQLYSKLTTKTYLQSRVNGRTVLDSRRIVQNLLSLIATGIVFFTLAVAIGFLNVQIATGLDDHALPQATVFLFDRKLSLVEWNYIYGFISPAAWGAVGASVYLVKSLSDHARNSSFDRQRVQGTGPRIFLGAIFAAVVTNLFAGEALANPTSMNLAPSALAFLTGLGVKVIYAGFQRMIDGLEDAIARGSGAAPETKKPGG